MSTARKSGEVKKFDPSEFGLYDEDAGKFLKFDENLLAVTGSLHLLKCRMRTCRIFDIGLKDVMEAFKVLNGRKVDGIVVNDLLGRYGFDEGIQENRVTIGKRYNKSRFSIELAESVLKDIVKASDVKQAYADYLRNHETAEKIKQDEDMISMGE
jgi:hypothetical protein